MLSLNTKHITWNPAIGQKLRWHYFRLKKRKPLIVPVFHHVGCLLLRSQHLWKGLGGNSVSVSIHSRYIFKNSVSGSIHSRYINKAIPSFLYLSRYHESSLSMHRLRPSTPFPTPCTAVYRSAHIPVNQPRGKCHEVYVRLRYTLYGSEALLWKRETRKRKPVAEYPTVSGMDLGPWSVTRTLRASLSGNVLSQGRMS